MKLKTSIALALLSILLLLSYKTYKEKKRDTKTEFMLKILPNEKILQNFSYTGIGLFHGHACSCENKSTVIHLKDRLNKEDGTIKARRDKELKHFKKRYGSVNNNVLIAPLNLPLSYPIHGTQVMPLHTIFLRGLSVYEEGNQNYEVTLEASLGTFNTFADVPEEQVEGRGNNKMTISTPYLQVLNHILQHVTYTSTVFDIDATDIVHFKMGNHKASFPVMIKQPPMPFLFDSGPDQKISSLVTITTKTFLRYDKVRLLIKSIHEFYPNITIIVADDNEITEKIEEPNVEQYFMPYAKGWFAGRNLAVSQVTTKYFLWVDDDFFFTKDTKIEKLVQVLEETDLDLVGGSVDNTAFKFRIVYQEGDEEGDCLYRRDGYYHNLEGFPNCVVASGVVNFFMAHARRVLAAGFDPKLNRVAHSEFFVDAFGSLRVGSCSDVVAGHQQRTPAQTDNEKKYVVFRQDTHEQMNFKMNLLYFKHNLKCYTYK